MKPVKGSDLWRGGVRCTLVLLFCAGMAGCGPIPPPPVRGARDTGQPSAPPETVVNRPVPVPGGTVIADQPASAPTDPDVQAAPPSEEDASPADTALDIPGVFHVVRPGQTVWRIANTYGVPLELLAEINDLDDPTVIEAGQRLFVPGAARVLEVHVFQPEELPDVTRTGDLHLQWPLTGTITSRFGGRRRHTGLDIAAPRNTPVLAAADGEVTYSGSGLRGYGNLVVIDHGRGVVTLYAHNHRNLVRKGDRVRRGDRVARVGSTGHSTGPHVHFEVQIDGKRVDPQRYLD